MYQQIFELLVTAQEADRYLRQCVHERNLEKGLFLLEDMQLLSERLCLMAGGFDKAIKGLDTQAYERDLREQSSVTAFDVWQEAVRRAFSPEPANDVEKSFQEIVKRIADETEEALIESMKRSFAHWRKNVPKQLSQMFINFQSTWKFWGDFQPDAGRFDMLEQRARCLKEHCGDFEWLYGQLRDLRSKAVLMSLLRYWLDLRPEPMQKVREYLYSSYFDLDLVQCSADEVFVDLGAYTGDTVLEYFNVYGEQYRRIYCYEILEQNVATIRKNLSGRRDIEIRSKGAGAKNGTLYLPQTIASDATRLQEKGTRGVPVAALDQDIKETITFLKMDIEGSEYDAIMGAQEHIKKDRPKLAVCIYHSNDDLWRLPRLIHAISPDYDFYLRYYGGGPEANGLKLVIADYVLYCIPKS